MDKKHKTISKNGKKGRNSKPKSGNQNEASGTNPSLKAIDLLVCPNGNTVCCLDKEDGTIQLLGGKIEPGENENNAVWRISQAKTGSGMFGIKKLKTITYQDPGDTDSPKIRVNLFVGETPINNHPKTLELWVPVSALLNKPHINGKTIRPLTRSIVSEMVALGYLKTESLDTGTGKSQVS